MSLSFADIQSAAEMLSLEPCAVQAVVDVESNGSGFLPSGKVRILFEGHVFWKELQQRGVNPESFDLPGILYPKFDRSKYKGGEAEWTRLDAAVKIHPDAALCSASWGLFQIMGFNYRSCGFDSVQSFVDAQKESEVRQLETFCNFMRREGLALFLIGRDWAGFARRYNGPGYAANQYDVKLRRAYERCRAGRV